MPIQHYEKGTYKGTVTNQRFGETPNGSTYFALEFEPTEATGANTFPETVYKREVTFYLTEKAAKYSIENLRRIGWKGTSFQSLDPTIEGYESLEGTELHLFCDYSDKGYEDWNLTAPGGGASKESKKGIASKLDKLFGKALKSSVPKSTEKPEAVTVPDDDDDEIPF